MYRVLRELSRGKKTIKVGHFTTLGWLSPDDAKRLETQGVVSKIHGPPLSEIPGWSRRAIRLQSIGIEQAQDFLEVENGVITKQMQVKNSTVERWRKELLGWLAVPKERRR